MKKYNICFIRIPKTASSSIMHFLYENLCDENDVVSRMYEWNDDVVEKKYHLNCPVLPHSHIDARYAIENEIVPKTAAFIGTIRDPIEKQLSLYLYRMTQGRYGSMKPSPEHFRSLMKYGSVMDKPQQMQSQSSFLEYEKDTKKVWWLYDNIENHTRELCEQLNVEIRQPLLTLNKSPGDTKKLIDVFYTQSIKDEVKEKYAEDWKIYEELKEKHLHRI